MVLAAVLALTLAAGTYMAGNSGELLQGRIVGGGTLSLSPSSPSGSRSVSASDQLFAFDLTASATKQSSIYAGTPLLFTLNTDSNDISISSVGSRVEILDQWGASAGYGFVVLDSYDQAWFTIYLKKDLQASAGTTSTFPIVMDTVTVLDDDAGTDDNVNVTMKHGTTTITGNTLKY